MRMLLSSVLASRDFPLLLRSLALLSACGCNGALGVLHVGVMGRWVCCSTYGSTRTPRCLAAVSATLTGKGL